MALNIKNAETERLARELARRRGTGVTEAVTEALKAELQRERGRLREPDLKDKLLRIAEEAAALPVYDERSDDEILGYDETGLPR